MTSSWFLTHNKLRCTVSHTSGKWLLALFVTSYAVDQIKQDEKDGSREDSKPLWPSGYYIYHHILHLITLRSTHTAVFVWFFFVDLRTNSHYFPIKHQLTGLYNRDGESLLRGTDLMLNYKSGEFLPRNRISPVSIILTNTVQSSSTTRRSYQ